MTTALFVAGLLTSTRCETGSEDLKACTATAFGSFPVSGEEILAKEIGSYPVLPEAWEVAVERLLCFDCCQLVLVEELKFAVSALSVKLGKAEAEELLS